MTFNIVKFSFCVCVCVYKKHPTPYLKQVKFSWIWRIVCCVCDEYYLCWRKTEMMWLDWNMSKHSFLWHISSFSIDGLKCYTLNKYTHPQLINGNKKEGSCLLLFYSRQINRDERLMLFLNVIICTKVCHQVFCAVNMRERGVLFSIYFDMMTKWSGPTIQYQGTQV